MAKSERSIRRGKYFESGGGEWVGGWKGRGGEVRKRSASDWMVCIFLFFGYYFLFPIVHSHFLFLGKN